MPLTARSELSCLFNRRSTHHWRPHYPYIDFLCSRSFNRFHFWILRPLCCLLWYTQVLMGKHLNPRRKRTSGSLEYWCTCERLCQGVRTQLWSRSAWSYHNPKSEEAIQRRIAKRKRPSVATGNRENGAMVMRFPGVSEPRNLPLMPAVSFNLSSQYLV